MRMCRCFPGTTATAAVAATALLLIGLINHAVHAIYEPDHWSYSTKLTASTFNDVIQKEIDAGRTMFVRWIASPG
jgi:hypothetical protein